MVLQDRAPIDKRDEYGRPLATPVVTGVRRGGKVEVTEGLAPGVPVVVSGHVRLRDRSQVEVAPPEAAPQGAPAA